MSDESINTQRLVLWIVAFLVFALAVAGGVLAALVIPSSVPVAVQHLLNKVFALNTVQNYWYMTRAAGLMAYLLLWLSTVWGLAVSSKVFDPWLSRVFSYDFHQFLSLLALGFIVLHVGVLVLDHYLPFSLAQILIPFIDTYRPLWVGIGIAGAYLALLVSVTFYLRDRLGHKTFKTIHYLSYLAYGSVILHAFFAGTDSPLLATQVMYAGTGLVVVFLTAYHIVMKLPAAAQQGKAEKARSQS